MDPERFFLPETEMSAVIIAMIIKINVIQAIEECKVLINEYISIYLMSKVTIIYKMLQSFKIKLNPYRNFRQTGPNSFIS